MGERFGTSHYAGTASRWVALSLFGAAFLVLAAALFISLGAPQENVRAADPKPTLVTFEYHNFGLGNTVSVQLVTTKNEVLSTNTVSDGGTFTVTKGSTPMTQLKIILNGTYEIQVHTSCSVPIGYGYVYSDTDGDAEATSLAAFNPAGAAAAIEIVGLLPVDACGVPTPTPSPTPSPTPTPPPNTDITVDKSAPATILPGGQITYNIVVTNLTGVAAQDVQMVDNIPPAQLFVNSATPSQGTCSGTVTCSLGTIPGGGTATITILATLNPAATGQVNNTVCVSTTTPETNTTNNCDTTTTTIPTPTPTPTPPPTPTPTLVPGTDITVDKIGPATALPGNQITYNITVSNIGASPAQNVFALDNLPAGTTFVSATPSQGSCAFVSCSLGTLNAGASATITIVVQVNPGATGTLTNTVCVSTSTPETNTNNNCDTTTTTIPTPTPTPPVVTPTPTPPIITPTPTPPVITPTPTPPPNLVDISVTKTDLPDPVFAGANLTYLITVTNHGPITANSVVAVDNLPAGVTFISATPSQGSCSFVSCSLGSMAPGATVAITVIVRVNAGTTGTLTNTVCVSTTTNEPNLSNNCDTTTTTVLTPTPTPSPSPTPSPTPVGQTPTPTPIGGTATPTPPPGPRANINLLKVDSPDPVAAGGTLTYGISVTNEGPDTATNVVVTDALPSGVTLISATPSQGTCNGTTCALGDIDAGDSVAIAFVVTVDASVSGDIENIACAATATQDPDLSDNCDDETTTVNPPGSPTPTALPVISPPAGPGGLPPTGGIFDAGSVGSWLMLALGAALLIGGGTAMIVSRRNRQDI